MTEFVETLRHQGALFLTTFALLPVVAGAYGLVLANRGGQGARRLASALSLVIWLLCAALVGARWVEAGRPPFKSLYESLLLFSLCLSTIYVVVERFYQVAWFGFITAASLWVVLGYAVLKADPDIGRLPAALQSPWFIPHVTVYFVGYSALFFAFVSAVLHLFKPTAVLTMRQVAGKAVEVTYAGFMHRAIQLGFLMLTLGLVFGAIWAKAAWGDYWGWDPKESWALVSWLIYAAYLHLRYTRGFTDRTGAIITMIGFITIVFTYLGMHLLPTAEQSAHTYQ
jgi:cytochrome c-type biogenesis protein CcsB